MSLSTEQTVFQIGQLLIVHFEQRQGGMQLLLGVSSLLGFGKSLSQ